MVPFRKVLDLLLPPRCAGCGQTVTQARTLCQTCWEKAVFIAAPMCHCCGLPFEIDVPTEALCLDCARAHPPFAAARSVFPYDDFSKKLILAFKQGDRTDLAPTLALWLHRSAQPLLEKCDLIAPVPLHWRRLLSRRYNQSALLALALSKLSHIPTTPQLIKRVRHTPSQGHLSRMARQKNLQGAFRVEKELTGKNILLIDDVLTTGATVLNCTRALHKAGAKDVYVVTLARVL